MAISYLIGKKPSFHSILALFGFVFVPPSKHEILHNHLLYGYLSHCCPFVNWVCFFKLSSIFRRFLLFFTCFFHYSAFFPFENWVCFFKRTLSNMPSDLSFGSNAFCFGSPFSRGQVYPCESKGASNFGFPAKSRHIGFDFSNPILIDTDLHRLTQIYEFIKDFCI